MNKRVIAIVTRERSGSTVFQRFLSTDTGYTSLGELWNTGAVAPQFYVYWMRRILESERNLRLNNLAGLFDEFVDEKLALSERGVVFDTKYGHLDNLKYFWAPQVTPRDNSMPAEPSLLRALKDRGSHIIHLVRRNKLAVYISLLRARESGVWHLHRRAEPSPTAALDVEIDSLTGFVTYEQRVDALVAHYLEGYARYLPLAYEEFLPEDTKRLTNEFVHSIARFLGDDADRFSPRLPLKKVVQGTLAEQLQRPAEVRAALAEIDAQWMLD